MYSSRKMTRRPVSRFREDGGTAGSAVAVGAFGPAGPSGLELAQALEQALTVDDFPSALNRLDSPLPILEDTAVRIARLAPLSAQAFLLFSGDNAELAPAYCLPGGAEDGVRELVDRLVEDQTVALALKRVRPFFVHDRERGAEILLFALGTSSRVRGLFLGEIKGGRKHLDDAGMSVLAVVLKHCANALESYELYGMLRNANAALESKVEQLEREAAIRRDAEAELRASRRMLRLVMNNIPQCVYWKDRNFRFLGCNSNFARLVGAAEPGEITGKTDAELPGRQNEAEYSRRMEEDVVFNNYAQLGVVESRLQNDGSVAWLETNRVPLHDGKGTVVGLLGTFQDITEKRQYQEQLTLKALHDSLTGLPNRALFMERLDRAVKRAKRRKEYRFAVLMLDLDRFKCINDAHGHPAGDEFLITAGRRIKDCLRSMDTVARMGGDEFAILLEEFNNNKELVRIAKRVQARVAEPVIRGGRRLYSSASCGLVIKTKYYERSEDIVRDADISMYWSKKHGGDRIKIFNAGLHRKALRAATLESDMRRGLARDEFFLVYQPIVNLVDGRLAGFEALARWRHPERGLLSPSEFIPIAEGSGMIHDLGPWIMRTALFTLASWKQSGNGFSAAAADLTLAVNLSSRQLGGGKLLGCVESAIRESGVAPEALHLEITETAVMEDPEQALHILEKLKSLGVKLSIDDFGTGYSSFSYLHRFPVDILKIDRSFIGKIEGDKINNEIIRSIILLARNIGMEVVAEGIETRSQYLALQGYDCHHAQGYYISRPMEAKNVPAYVKAFQTPS